MRPNHPTDPTTRRPYVGEQNARGAPTVISVNRQIIDRNRKLGRNDPPNSVRHGKGGSVKFHSHDVVIYGPSRLRYDPKHPLPCGARLWMETYHTVVGYRRSRKKDV